MPFIIGLTGNIATGKSTVLQYFAARGAQVIDADRLTHQAMAPGGLAYGAIIASFGQDILHADGMINRPALGKVVFADPAALQRLEQMIHPAVFTLAQQAIAASSAQVIIIEAIKLLEARNLVRLCQEIWVVMASEETQLRRLRETRGMDEAEARRRMAAQSPQTEKIQQADQVIHNDGTPAELEQQLDKLWREVEQKVTSDE
jgi:dephospho-CoA kinase